MEVLREITHLSVSGPANPGPQPGPQRVSQLRMLLGAAQDWGHAGALSRGAAAGTAGRDVVRGSDWLYRRHNLLSRHYPGQGPTWFLRRRSFLSAVLGEDVVPWFAHSPSLVFQPRPGSSAPCPLLLHGWDQPQSQGPSLDQPACTLEVGKRGWGRPSLPHSWVGDI